MEGRKSTLCSVKKTADTKRKPKDKTSRTKPKATPTPKGKTSGTKPKATPTPKGKTSRTKPKAKDKEPKKHAARKRKHAHECILCHKVFGEKFNLTKHMLIHLGKNYSCENCTYSGKSPHHLKEHTDKCVQGKKFTCRVPGCDAVFQSQNTRVPSQKKNPCLGIDI